METISISIEAALILDYIELISHDRESTPVLGLCSVR